MMTMQTLPLQYAPSTTLPPCTATVENIPSEFICPLSLQVMVHPWVTKTTGLSFERAAIFEWLSNGTSICPVTNEPMSIDDLVPNHRMAMMLSFWRASHNVSVSKLTVKEAKKLKAKQHRESIRQLQQQRDGSQQLQQRTVSPARDSPTQKKQKTRILKVFRSQQD